VPDVKLNKYGFAYVRVYVKTLNASIMTPIDYKVDTGANRTAISRDYLGKLGGFELQQIMLAFGCCMC
jgi:hypothetical protein